METKICRKCHRELPLGLFGKMRNCRDGINSQCKDCRATYMRGYYEKIRVKKPIVIKLCIICDGKYRVKNSRQVTCARPKCRGAYQVIKVNEWRRNHPDEWRHNREEYLERVKRVSLYGQCIICKDIYPMRHTVIGHCPACAKVSQRAKDRLKNKVWQKTIGREVHNKLARNHFRRKRGIPEDKWEELDRILDNKKGGSDATI